MTTFFSFHGIEVLSSKGRGGNVKAVDYLNNVRQKNVFLQKFPALALLPD
jgi:hypothetical protein